MSLLRKFRIFVAKLRKKYRQSDQIKDINDGQISVDGNSSNATKVKSISFKSMLVDLQEDAEIQAEFYVHSEQFKFPRKVRTAWRRANRIKIEFIDDE